MKRAALTASAILLSMSCFGLEVINYGGDKEVINVSANSVNKIILPSRIKSKAFSKEKNLQIQVSGNELYVKFMPQTEQMQSFDEQGKPLPLSSAKLTYQRALKSELFVETDSGSYLFILNPVGRDAETFKINDQKANLQKAFEFESKDEYREILKKITSSAYDFANGQGIAPDGYEVSELKGQSFPYGQKLNVTPKYKFKGKLFTAFLFDVKNVTSNEISMEPKAFLKLPVKGKISISSLDASLAPYASTIIAIIAKDATNEN